jgi:hypothetical protein
VLFGYYHTWLAPIEDAMYEKGALQTCESKSAAGPFACMQISTKDLREWATGYEGGEYTKLHRAVDRLCKEAKTCFERNSKVTGATKHSKIRNRKMMTIWDLKRFEVTAARGTYHYLFGSTQLEPVCYFFRWCILSHPAQCKKEQRTLHRNVLTCSRGSSH